ncbi:MAG: type II secretion system F family protein [Calditrichaeota bacterium]|nr:MAG: type II secretion system F family protein [Calditrichota bacterium]
MPLFKYTAKASPEEIVSGEMQAESLSSITAKLSEMGLFPLSILQDKQKSSQRHTFKSFFKKNQRTTFVLFTRQLASMLDAGVTLHTAIQFVARQMQGSMLTDTLTKLIRQLHEGYRFSEACAKMPDVFSEFYINMIRAGETGGMLALVLDHLADTLEKEDGIRKQIRAAMAYPVFMLGMGFITITLLLTFVVPRIVSMFNEIGQTLPLATRILISISDLFANYWGLLLMLVAGGIYACNSAKKQSAFVKKIHKAQLALPYLGSLVIQGEIAQFARILSALVKHGVPIQNAFKVVIAACKNVVVRSELSVTAKAIENGEKIGTSLGKNRFFPPLLSQMIRIAEDTNQLETVLGRIANTSEKEVERQVAMFTSLLEPVMIVVVGAIVGFIVFAMMMPIFQMDFMVQ